MFFYEYCNFPLLSSQPDASWKALEVTCQHYMDIIKITGTTPSSKTVNWAKHEPQPKCCYFLLTENSIPWSFKFLHQSETKSSYMGICASFHSFNGFNCISRQYFMYQIFYIFYVQKYVQRSSCIIFHMHSSCHTLLGYSGKQLTLQLGR